MDLLEDRKLANMVRDGCGDITYFQEREIPKKMYMGVKADPTAQHRHGCVCYQGSDIGC